MKRMKVPQRLVDDVVIYTKHHSSTILTCIGVAGVVLTSILTAKATIKVLKKVNEAECEKKEELTTKEIVRLAVPSYLPPFLVGTSTIVCILGANALNKQQQAALISAYTLADTSLKEYKNKLKELYGEDAHKAIIDSIAVEHAEDVYIYNESMFNSCALLDPNKDQGKKMIFYDEFSHRYFESTMEQVLNAEYHLNRNFILRGYCTLNEFYEFLGLREKDYGNALGWAVEDDLYWIDFDHRKTKGKDDTEYYILEMMWEPSSDFLEYIYH